MNPLDFEEQISDSRRFQEREFGPGETYSYYPSNISDINFPVGRLIEEHEKFTLNAHIHLEVSGNNTTDVWHETEHAWTHTFDENDNP